MPTLFLKSSNPISANPPKRSTSPRMPSPPRNRTNPFFLDTLAWAYFRSGEAPKAAETEREALSLLPAGAKGGLA